MKIEILFSEICNLYGDAQNGAYLKHTLPDAEFYDTTLLDTPYFVTGTPDLIYLGGMSERTQRRVIEKLRPYTDRLRGLIENGTVILATGNAGEIFMKHISYVTEEIGTDALGLVDLSVTTDVFDRFNGKVLGTFEDMDVVGFQSQFSVVHGDVSAHPFLRVKRGTGYDKRRDFEGVRYKNLFCTSLLGPILPLNPLFTEYLLRLRGCNAPAAFREEAMAAYERRVGEFKDPETKF